MKLPIYEISKIKDNRIYIKREDLIPFSFGGNKARKALLFLKEIEKGNYDCIVTYGSSSSNHCRIISNMAAMKNLPCCIISPLEIQKVTYNSCMMELFGAEIVYANIENVYDTIQQKLTELTCKGYTPYFIPGGGHGNLGTQAYIECYEEIVEYEKENNIKFDYIFFASGTGTTHAGLVCGKLLHQNSGKIVGISIARKNPRGREIVINSINEYLKSVNRSLPQEVIEEATIFEDRYIVSGYGKKNEHIIETIKEMIVRYGIPMDSTYTGKAFCGMKEYITDCELHNRNILFIHTGGTPLFFDDLYTFSEDNND